ncbi:MAG: class I SAM-dependent methyltransferase [Candidatus Rokubacteria bacterium]|nr:class I SAM-dependent methyltransferase [Candidatus Rokubacteria bacterium]
MRSMSSRAGEPLAARLEAYYTRYYRDTLGIPGWRDIVAVRVADRAYERQRLAQLERALGRPVRGQRLLNLGCGTGGFSEAAAQAGAEVWSVDASHDAVAITAARADRARALVAAAEALPFVDGSFDVVYCFSTLEHVADAGDAVREMVRVLRRDGTIYLHTPNRWACFEGHYKIFWVPGLPRWLSRAYLGLRGRPTAFLDTFRLLTLAECRRLLDAAGARVVRIGEDDAGRPAGGSLWPLVRAYYRLFGVRPYLELVAARRR